MLADSKGLTALHYACLEPRCVELFPISEATELKLSGMRLTRVAPNLFQAFPRLTALDLSCNQLTDLPQSFLRLTSLTRLNLTGNPSVRMSKSLPELRGALERRENKKQQKTVTTIVTGLGTRDWLYGQSALPPLFRQSALTRPNSKKLTVIDTVSPTVFELLLSPRALYVVTVPLPALDVELIFKQIASFRLKPPVVLVGTEAERLDSVQLDTWRLRAQHLATQLGVNLVSVFTLGLSIAVVRSLFLGDESFFPMDQERALKDALFQHSSDPLFAKASSPLVSKLIARHLQQPLVELSELERFADAATVQEVIFKAAEIGLVTVVQDAVFQRSFLAQKIPELLGSALFIRRLELAERWQSLTVCVQSKLIAFLAQAGLMLPFRRDHYVLPCNAPVLASPPLLQAEHMRQYAFATVTLGLARRFAARLAHIPSARVYRGVVLYYRVQQPVAMVRTDDSVWTLFATELSLFLELVNCAESLLAEHTERVYRSAINDGLAVPLSAENAPDWAFAGLPNLPPLPPAHELGQGGGGTVYQSQWMGTPVAVKKFKDSPLPTVIREVGLSFAVQHPNLVTSIAVICSPPALVMELFPLQDLCQSFHFPNPALAIRRSRVQETLAQLDQERAEIMANFSEMGARLEDLNSRYTELESEHSAVRQETLASDLMLPLGLRIAFMLDLGKALQPCIASLCRLFTTTYALRMSL